MEKFARKCSQCSRLMNNGYILYDGHEYYCSDECLHRTIPLNEFRELYETQQAYHTEWEDEEDFQYYEDGSEVEE